MCTDIKCHLIEVTACSHATACPTIKCQRLGEGQNSNVPAVVINVGNYKGQVAAVVNNGLHLRHVSIDWFVVDGAQKYTPAVNKAIAPGMGKVKKKGTL